MDSDLVNNQYSLSIRIFSDGFSLFIYDEKHQIISSKHLKIEQGDEITDLLKNLPAVHKEIHQDYKDIAIICESKYHTILPEIFHKAENQKDFLKLQHPALPDSCLLFHTRLASQQSVLVFGLEESILNIFAGHFHQIKPESHLVDLTRRIIRAGKDKLTLWIRPEEIDCIVYKDHKIILLNKFNYQSSEDIVYHMLNIYEQLELKPGEFMSEVFDDANLQTETLIRKYIPTVVFKSKQSVYEDYQWEV